MLALQSVSQVAAVRVVLRQLQARPAHRIYVGKTRSRPDNRDAPLTGLELLQQLVGLIITYKGASKGISRDWRHLPCSVSKLS